MCILIKIGDKWTICKTPLSYCLSSSTEHMKFTRITVADVSPNSSQCLTQWVFDFTTKAAFSFVGG